MMSKSLDFNDPKPLYEQIVDDIKRKIECGEYKPGDQIGTQRELAHAYNVSLITVKSALSYLVSGGILFARAGRGTFVSERPIRRIDLSKQKAIGLVLRDLKHPYFSMIVHSIEERAYELGFNVLLSSSSGSFEKEEAQIDRFKAMGAEGLIIASLSLEFRATDYIQRLHQENFPYIMVSYIHDPDYWYVGSDHEQGGFMATEHLIALGYKAIGYVHVSQGHLLSEVRKNGYYRAIMEYGVPYSSDLIYDIGSTEPGSSLDRYQLGYQFGKKFRYLSKVPEALFCYNDIVALGFIQAAAEEGIKIPDDVAVVGFDDTTVSRFASIPLTTIHQPVDHIGRLAVEIIQKRIDKSDIGNRTILKPSLIVRDSCGARRRAKLNSQDQSVTRMEEPRIKSETGSG